MVAASPTIELRRIYRYFGETCAVGDVSFEVREGEVFGYIGPNGAGKTTLLNLLTGKLAPDSGTVRLGTNLETVTLDQKRESLPVGTTLKDALTGGGKDMIMVGDTQRHVISYMKDFLFSPEQARTPITELSGGEKGRLMLARALAKPSNLLILDEPTNDLDLVTLDLLQEMLAAYEGTVLLVSHDRDFLDRLVSSVINAEGNGLWQEYAGGYSDMASQRKTAGVLLEELGTKAAKQNTSTTKSAPARAKLTFKDKHALETLPKEMAKLETAIQKLKDALAKADFFSRDPEGFQKTAGDLEAAEADLANMEEQWLELEMKREEIEGSA